MRLEDCIPYEDWTYRSKLSDEKIVHNLLEIVEPKKLFRTAWSGGSTKAYEGKVSITSFKVKRLLNYRNSFAPVIFGSIESQADDSTLVHVKMRLSTFTMIFLSIWIGIAIISCIGFMASSFFNREFKLGVFVPFGMLLLVILMIIGGFKYESSKTRASLKQVFDAYEMSTNF